MRMPSGKPRCGEKSPWHLLAVPELMAALSACQVPVDDPRWPRRGTVLPGMPFFTWEPDWWHCQTWCRAAALAECYRRRYPDRFLICRFEALVEEPVAEVKRIDEFLGLAFEPSQLVMSERDAAPFPAANGGSGGPGGIRMRVGPMPGADRQTPLRLST